MLSREDLRYRHKTAAVSIIHAIMLQENRFEAVTQFKMSRTVLGWNLFYVASYFVDGLLIDTGFDRMAQKFFTALRSRAVEQIVNTHHHEDHVGANFLFEEKMKLHALAHPRAIPLIAQPPARLKPYRNQTWGVPRAAHASPCGDKIQTPKYKFQVLHLPGHSEDHIGLYEPQEGWLFSGDLFLSVKVRVLRIDEDLQASLASLRKVVGLPMSRLFCGSGRILENPNEALRLKLNFYEELQARARELRAQGWPTERIRDRLLGKEDSFHFLSQNEFAKLHLIKGLLETTHDAGTKPS